MRIGDKHYESIWLDSDDNTSVSIIDQSKLPFKFEIIRLKTVDDVFNAIRNMNLRGAPLIGVAAAYGMYLATLEITAYTKTREHLRNASRYLRSARPTAVNLEWAVNRQMDNLSKYCRRDKLIASSLKTARDIASEETTKCRKIGEAGMEVIKKISKSKKGRQVNILTHCNAGWLACVDYGTATAPVYLAHDKGIKVHVWVDETRPRNQGARLTAWELENHGVPYTLITDNTGGYLMQKGDVDIIITGSDRTTVSGDTANKSGTYLKALAARHNNIPFYVALPTSSVDISISNGLKDIPVEERDEKEVLYVEGLYDNEIINARICPEKTRAANYAFDITPADLITGLITEKGICRAKEEEIRKLLSEKKN
ncbi:MAG TPA: S-methyl-5-thioribose-1-phosphate isomerase [Bacteroidales bacterium]|nr:S-methyl-5-thioribose-1-phosphate isomerase [Bacteroidales bacterium]